MRFHSHLEFEPRYLRADPPFEKSIDRRMSLSRLIRPIKKIPTDGILIKKNRGWSDVDVHATGNSTYGVVLVRRFDSE